MIDVHIGVLLAALHDEVDERFERRALFAEIAGPERAILALFAEVHAEEVLEAALGRVERIALHVEVDVALIGRRELGEAAFLFVLQEFVEVAFFRALPVLECRLRAQRRERRLDHSERPLLVGRSAERADRRDAGRGEPIDLTRAHPGDEAQIVVRFAPVFAVLRPTADQAMWNFGGIGFRYMTRACQKLRLLMAIVRRVVVDPKVRFEARTEHEVAVDRHRSLQPGDVFAVVAELQ
jgi:hypothetical protein